MFGKIVIYRLSLADIFTAAHSARCNAYGVGMVIQVADCNITPVLQHQRRFVSPDLAAENYDRFGIGRSIKRGGCHEAERTSIISTPTANNPVNMRQICLYFDEKSGFMRYHSNATTARKAKISAGYIMPMCSIPPNSGSINQMPASANNTDSSFLFIRWQFPFISVLKIPPRKYARRDFFM